MDTSIILFIIFGLIVWLDAKRRSKKIAQRWEDVGGKQTMFSKPRPKIETFIELKFMNAPEDVDEDEDDIEPEEVKIIPLHTPINTEVAEAALYKLGYRKTKIKKVVKTLIEKSDGKSTDIEIIKQALSILNS
jgi:hypothetical protein